MRTILYLHDIHHSSDKAVAFLKDRFPSDRIMHPEIPLLPKEAMKYLHAVYDKMNVDLVVGNGLGAFYALTFNACKKVLLNPSIIKKEDIDLNYKDQTLSFNFARKDEISTFRINDSFRNDLKAIYDKIFNFKVKGTDDRFGFNPYNTFIAVDKETFQSERFEFLNPYLFSDHVEVFGGSTYADANEFYRGVIPFISNASYYDNKGTKEIFSRGAGLIREKQRCPVCRQKTLAEENDFCENCGWNEEFDSNSYLCQQSNLLDETTYERMSQDITYFGRIMNARKAFAHHGTIR